MKGIIGKLNTSTVLSMDAQTKPQLKIGIDNPIKVGSSFRQFGNYVILPDQICSSVQVKYEDMANSITLDMTCDASRPLSKIYVRLPNPGLYHIPEFFVEGHFDFDVIKDHINQKSISGRTVNQLISDEKIATFVNRLYIKKIGAALVKAIILETEFGQMIRIKKEVEVDI